MRRFERKACPDVLLEAYAKRNDKPKWVVWGEKYQANRRKNEGFIFQWPQVRNQKLNQLLLPDLKGQTDSHCSYCDGFPLKSGERTIDHFKPKSEFPLEVCCWENLYLACTHCQSAEVKGDKYDERLLRPDEETYQFEEYFYYDYTTHQIKVLQYISEEKQLRASITMEILAFNNLTMIECRRQMFDGFNDKPDYPNELIGYRFMFPEIS